MIRVVSAQEDDDEIREAAQHAAAEGAWLLFHVGLAAGTAALAWWGLPGVWPALLWVLAGVIVGDALGGVRSTWLAVRDWRLMRRSPATRALRRDLDEAAQRTYETYRVARRAETERQGRSSGRRGRGVRR